MLFNIELNTLILITYLLFSAFFLLTIRRQIKTYQEKTENADTIELTTMMPILATSSYYLLISCYAVIRLI